jgi:FkbM family methyltransferase
MAPVEGKLQADDPKRPIVFVGCDEVYLSKYVPALAYSLEEQREFVTLHIHVYDPGKVTVQAIALLLTLEFVNVSLTWERLGGALSVPRNIYFACTRFVRAWQVLCANDVPALLVDADAIFNRPVTSFPGFDNKSFDVTVVTRKAAPAWERVIAGAVLLQPTRPARAWLGTVASVIAANLVGARALWFLDQIALSLAYERGGAVRFLAAPAELCCDTRHGNEAVVWAVTVNKQAESRFLTRTRELLGKYNQPTVDLPVEENPNEVAQSAYGPILLNRHDMYIGPSIKATGGWCQMEIDAMGPLIRPADTVFDIGANFGIHTLAFSRFVGAAGRVYAFEPQRLVWQNLVGSLAINWIRNVHAMNVAIGDHTGEVRVPPISYNVRNNIGALSLRDGWTGNSEVNLLAEAVGELVPLLRLDDWQVSECRLIKIDVEGMEMAVLSGAVDLIGRLRPICYVEFHTDRDAIASFFAELGYRLFLHAVPGNPNLLCLPDMECQIPPVPHLMLLTDGLAQGGETS